MNEAFDDSEFIKFADEFANRYPQYALEAAVPAMEAMSNFLLGKIPEYPSETIGRIINPDGASFLRTDAQRKWFWASIREDKIPGWKMIDGHPTKVGGGRT